MKRGRKRKSTRKRHPGGQLVRRHINPVEIAAQMPHRRGLGPFAVDQRAECELGRMALKGWISTAQYLAGQQFARDYGQYLTTIAPPSQLGGSGQAFDCGGCLGMSGTNFCVCESRKATYMASVGALAKAGPRALEMVVWVVLKDRVTFGFDDISELILGLDALARHYGLTKGPKSPTKIQNSKSVDARP
jgi:hypothetical protein